jgi:hypothetical protein
MYDMSAEPEIIPQADNHTIGGTSAGVKRSRRSGSEQRKKQRRITFRLTDGEYGAVQVAADRAGVTLGTHVRDRVLSSPETRRRPRPTVEVQAVTRLQGEMNRVGGNIHQILKRVNFGETPLAHEFHEALAGYKEVIESILTVLGRR